MLFLNRITELIHSQGITKNKLLVDLELNKSSFFDWERRGTVPSGDVVAKIADYFNVSADYLLGRTDDPRPVRTEKTELCFRSDGWMDSELEDYNKLKYDDQRRRFIQVNGYDKDHEPDARRLLPNQFLDEKEPTPVTEIGQNLNIVKIAGRDGSHIERRLTDEQITALKLIIDQLPDADNL